MVVMTLFASLLCTVVVGHGVGLGGGGLAVWRCTKGCGKLSHTSGVVLRESDGCGLLGVVCQ